MTTKEIMHKILKIAVVVAITLALAIIKILILYFIIPPIFNLYWKFNCWIFGIFGIENENVLRILFFLFTWISPTSIKIASVILDGGSD